LKIKVEKKEQKRRKGVEKKKNKNKRGLTPLIVYGISGGILI